MEGVTLSTLHAWESFYVIVGSSAGALTGLQFVVLTLITESGALRGSGETLAAFGSPNVVHFCAALLVSAIFSAPWQGLGPPGIAAALCGACGVFYSIAVLRRAMRQRDYKPVLEDWVMARRAAHDRLRRPGLRWPPAQAGSQRHAVFHRRRRAAPGFHRHPQCLGHGGVYHHGERPRAEGQAAARKAAEGEVRRESRGAVAGFRRGASTSPGQ